ncbi:MAG: type I-E CRISPR-associated protein Cse2/CasB [Chloroflexota bacterium]|jgi:CRISPR system Cascade subunit CasB|nr:type I-E CRISPR-associated protein Cse2/CasB [Chloroflexota bacterium]
MTAEPHSPFIAYLEQLRDRQDRAALAHLRRGLGRKPGEAPEMYPYVVPWLPNDPWADSRYFLIASLFALHPLPGGSGNMGAHFARIRQAKGSEDATERRFVSLLAAHADDLAYHLRQAVTLCKANSIPVNWAQLFRDVQYWGAPSGSVQRAWARAYWGRSDEDSPSQPE